MANTVNNTRLHANPRKVVQYVTIVSDGTEETDLVVYDSSAVATAIGETDSTSCTLLKLRGVVEILDKTAVDVSVYLEFDATTDVHAISLPIGTEFELCFEDIGGLKNYAGSGKTGDIVLTTTGLESGDRISLVLEVRP